MAIKYTACVAILFVLSFLQGSVGTSRSIQGLKLEALEPNIISVDKSDRFTVLQFKLSSSRPNHNVEEFNLEAKTVDGIILSVFPSSVRLTRSPRFVRVVIRSISPWVKCGQPYGVILTASNKFTKLTDAFVIHVTGDDGSASGSGDFKLY